MDKISNEEYINTCCLSDDHLNVLNEYREAKEKLLSAVSLLDLARVRNELFHLTRLEVRLGELIS